MYLIWSYEHQMWWRWNSQGYTERLSEAGRYEADEAIDITYRANAIPGGLNEVIVPEKYAGEHTDYHTWR